MGVGIELALSGGAASAIRRRAISLAPHTSLKKIKFKMRWRHRPEGNKPRSECIKSISLKRNKAGWKTILTFRPSWYWTNHQKDDSRFVLIQLEINLRIIRQDHT